jgi:hypothetical protein
MNFTDFSYKDSFQEHTGDAVQYYDCTLKKDIGPFKKGETVEMIEIDTYIGGHCGMCIEKGDQRIFLEAIWNLATPTATPTATDTVI